MPETLNKENKMQHSGFISKIWLWFGIIVLTLSIGIIDYLSGYELSFFAFYFIPISISAWYLGLVPTTIIAGLSATIWFLADYYTGHRYSLYVFAFWNTAIRLISFIVIGSALARLREIYNKEHKARMALERALSEVKVLEGMLPVCASCKKIRNDKGEWQQMEEYIGQKTNAEFTHGLCPQCGKTLMQEAGMGGGAEKKGAV